MDELADGKAVRQIIEFGLEPGVAHVERGAVQASSRSSCGPVLGSS